VGYSSEQIQFKNTLSVIIGQWIKNNCLILQSSCDWQLVY